MKKEIHELRDIADGKSPGDMHSEKLRVSLKNMGLAYRDDAHPWAWHLTDHGRDLLELSKTTEIVNVKDFGAKGDGKTDDRKALTKAIQSGKGLFLPPGTYRSSGTIG